MQLFDDNDFTPAEARLAYDAFFGALSAEDDDYYRDGVRLIRTINQPAPEQVRKALETYLRYAKDNALRADIETVLQSLGGAA